MGNRRQLVIVKAQTTVMTVGNQLQVKTVHVAKTQTAVTNEWGISNR